MIAEKHNVFFSFLSVGLANTAVNVAICKVPLCHMHVCICGL